MEIRLKQWTQKYFLKGMKNIFNIDMTTINEKNK